MLIKASVFGANARVVLPHKMEDVRQEPPVLVIHARAQEHYVPHSVLASSTTHSSSDCLLRRCLCLVVRHDVLDGFPYLLGPPP